MGAYESGTAFLAGVLAKLPESQRAQVEAAFTSAEARDAVMTLGDGTLARSDYSRQMDEIRQRAEQLEQQHQAAVQVYEDNLTWRAANEAALADAVRVRQGSQSTAASTAAAVPQPAPAAVDPRAIFDEEMGKRERDYAAFVGYTQQLGLRHLQTFGEVLDVPGLLNDPRVGKPIPGQPGRVFSLQDAYQATHGERLAQKATEVENARIDKLVNERFAERMKTTAAQPFPMRSEPSPLDVLNNPEAAKLRDDDYLDRALETYTTLVGSRT